MGVITSVLIPITLEGFLPIALYSESRGPISLKSRSSLPVGLQVLLAIVTPTTLPSWSESRETLMTYSSQRLLKHFGFDPKAVWVSRGNYIDVSDTKFRYMAGGRDLLLGNSSCTFFFCLACSRGRPNSSWSPSLMRCVEACI